MYTVICDECERNLSEDTGKEGYTSRLDASEWAEHVGWKEFTHSENHQCPECQEKQNSEGGDE